MPTAKHPYITLAVVILLGFTVLATVVGGIWLAAGDSSLPGELIAIGAGAGGALAGYIAQRDVR